MIKDIFQQKTIEEKIVINEPNDIYNLLKEYLDYGKRIHILVTLNDLKEVIQVHIIHYSSFASGLSIVDASNVFHYALKDNSKHVFFCMMRVMDDFSPSHYHDEKCNELFKAGDMLEIKTDQMIISKKGYSVLKYEGEE